MDFAALSHWIGNQSDAMVQLQADLTARPAIGPDNGGKGEWERARFLEQYLAGHGIERIEHYDCPDDRVPEGTRPNLVATVPGQAEAPHICVLTHLDVVPPGRRKEDGSYEGWKGDPFELRRVGDRIFGRGVTDNQQSIVSSVFAARALLEHGLQPAHDVRLLFVSDEETGSERGLGYLLDEHRELFSEDDLIIVPDAGNEDGSMVEVAEKSVLWVEFTVAGQQAHGSRPDRAVNAFRAASRLVCRLDEQLHERYSARDELFDPPVSTFEPTLHAANVPNVNTIPGQDVFCFDCRVLPDNDLDDLLDMLRAAAAETDEALGTDTTFRIRTRMDAPPATPPDAPVVRLLCNAVREVLDVEARPMGVGGMTVASLFRRAGLPVAAWMTAGGGEHEANESCPIANMVNDARVFARVFAKGISSRKHYDESGLG
ncbi:MAG: M20 family metallo-hydrolase [Candidatus Brocadiia bacterium]